MSAAYPQAGDGTFCEALKEGLKLARVRPLTVLSRMTEYDQAHAAPERVSIRPSGMPPAYARRAVGLKRSKPSRLARRFNVKRAASREHVVREPVLDTYDDEDPDFDEGALTALFGDPEEETPPSFAGESSFVHEPRPGEEEEDTPADEEPKNCAFP